MGQIVWTEKAAANLAAIHDYIARDSEFYAVRFIKSLIHHTSILNTMPTVGRIVPEFNNSNIRELVYRDYRLVYRLEKDNNVSMLAVIQGNMLIENAMEQ